MCSQYLFIESTPLTLQSIKQLTLHSCPSQDFEMPYFVRRSLWTLIVLGDEQDTLYSETKVNNLRDLSLSLFNCNLFYGKDNLDGVYGSMYLIFSTQGVTSSLLC